MGGAATRRVERQRQRAGRAGDKLDRWTSGASGLPAASLEWVGALLQVHAVITMSLKEDAQTNPLRVLLEASAQQDALGHFSGAVTVLAEGEGEGGEGAGAGEGEGEEALVLFRSVRSAATSLPATRCSARARTRSARDFGFSARPTRGTSACTGLINQFPSPPPCHSRTLVSLSSTSLADLWMSTDRGTDTDGESADPCSAHGALCYTKP